MCVRMVSCVNMMLLYHSILYICFSTICFFFIYYYYFLRSASLSPVWTLRVLCASVSAGARAFINYIKQQQKRSTLYRRKKRVNVGKYDIQQRSIYCTLLCCTELLSFSILFSISTTRELYRYLSLIHSLLESVRRLFAAAVCTALDCCPLFLSCSFCCV